MRWVSRDASGSVTQPQSRGLILLGVPDTSRESALGSPPSVDAHSGWRASHLLVIGPPGAGKGTQGEILSDCLGITHVSAGALLREAIGAGSPLGRIAGRFVARGLLVPDKLVLRLVYEKVRGCKASKAEAMGILLDGVPRTLRQAETLDTIMVSNPICAVVHLHVSDEVARARLVTRGRPEDTEAVIGRRLSMYHRFTVPMVAWMTRRRPVLTVDGDRSVAEVSADIARRLDPLFQLADGASR